MDLNRYIQQPELLSRETLYVLRNYVALYPCQQAARLLMLHNLYLLHDPTFDDELRRAAFYITDRTALFNILEAPLYQLAPDETPAASAASTDSAALIDTFLDTVHDSAAADHKPTAVEATVDYMAYLMAHRGAAPANDEAAQGSSEGSLIDSFLASGGGKLTLSEGAPEEDDGPHTAVPIENDKDDLQEGYYTESLAKVYVKQGDYAKALEIIKQLNLNNSEKSSYFADQMRFLEKVIAAKGKK